MPDIRPYDTASPSETRRSFEPLKFHRIFSCHWFCNTKHITSATNNATLIDTGKNPTTFVAFATTPKANEGKSKPLHRHFLEKCPIDIFYGDFTSMGGYCYVILLVDVATRYCWFYGLKSTTSKHFIKTLSQFSMGVGHLPADSTPTSTENS